MAITTITSREFNQAVSEAKRAANDGPVFITDRDRPAHVLMSMEFFQRLAGNQKKIAELLAMPGEADADFEIPSLAREIARPADLS